MPDLAVPTPVVTFDRVASGAATLEKPIDVKCAAVMFPNGNAFDQSKLGAAGFFTYRQSAPGALFHIWDEGAKEWTPDPGAPLPDAQPKPFAFKQGDPLPWQGLLIAVGQKDKAGQNQFAPAVNDFPLYFTRAYFASTVAGTPFSGLSAPSASVRFIRVADTMLAGVEIGEGEEPPNATQIRVFLRYPEKHNIGIVQITRSGSDAQVDIANLNANGSVKAVIRLLANGDISLEPAPGRRVIVAAPLETETILYRPAGGGAKQLLV